MQPYHWSLAGLLIDVVGAFFLSVEAIKLDNVAKLRDRVFVPLHRGIVGPSITITDDPTIKTTPGIIVTLSLVAWLILHFLGAVLLTAPVLWLVHQAFDFDVLSWLWGLQNLLWPWARIPTLLVTGFVGTLFLAVTVGELAHHLLVKASLVLVNSLFWIDRKSPDGTIGICGFCLLLLGFLGQMIGTWLGRTGG